MKILYLLYQLQKLNHLMQKPLEGGQSRTQVEAANSMDSESENGGTMKCEEEEKPSPSVERSEHVHGVLSDDDGSIKVEDFGLEDEHGLLNFGEHADDSLTSPEDWSAFESDGLLGQTTGDYQWWDFWSWMKQNNQNFCEGICMRINASCLVPYFACKSSHLDAASYSFYIF